jgi:hypothetical protein
VFHFDRGLKLTRPDLAVDFRRRQPRGFISHAHTDHMAPHELALCTAATAELYRLRFGQRRVMEIPYRTALEWGGLRLTAFPAGHCLGSAMLLADDGHHTLLYTGDFKLSASATAEAAELPRADVLVMECTFGSPMYRFPPRDEVVGQLRELVRRILASDRTPVVHAYALGKAQEVIKLLTDDGIPVVQHADVYRVSCVYQRLGISLGPMAAYPGHHVDGHAVVAPPGRKRLAQLTGLRRPVHIAVTGWALHQRTRLRWGVDYAVPLSDHASYDELFAAIEQVEPSEIHCTHGPDVDRFVQRLCDAGHHAYRLGACRQRRLF